MATKRVLFICSVYLPNIGGIETTIKYLSEYYLSIGYSVSVLTKKYPFDLKSYENIDGVNVIRIDRPKDEITFLQVGQELQKYKDLIQADVIHVIGVRRPMPLVAFALAEYWQIPLLFNYAGGDVPMDEQSSLLWEEGRYTVKPFLDLGTGHIAFSEGIIDAVEKSTKIKRKKIDKIFGFIDESRFKYSVESPLEGRYIFSARRLVKDKGLDLLIKAYGETIKDFPDVSLCIAGDGEEREVLLDLVKDLGLENHVKFLGSLPYQDMLNWMHFSECHVCPSRVEGGGLVNIEASYAGTIPIGSRIGGIPEYIMENETGLLFHNESVKDLADKIKLVLGRKIDTDMMIKNGNLWSSQFKIQTIAEQYLCKYKTSSSVIEQDHDLPKKSQLLLDSFNRGFRINKKHL
jgi:glycosyltransferase involved in cell wall biosynthesis